MDLSFKADLKHPWHNNLITNHPFLNACVQETFYDIISNLNKFSNYIFRVILESQINSSKCMRLGLFISRRIMTTSTGETTFVFSSFAQTNVKHLSILHLSNYHG